MPCGYAKLKVISPNALMVADSGVGVEGRREERDVCEMGAACGTIKAPSSFFIKENKYNYFRYFSKNMLDIFSRKISDNFFKNICIFLGYFVKIFRYF